MWRLLAGLGGKVLIAGLVAPVEQDAPDEVGGEPAQQNHDEHRQAGPQTVLAMDGDEVRAGFRHRQRGFLFRQGGHFLNDFEFLGIHGDGGQTLGIVRHPHAERRGVARHRRRQCLRLGLRLGQVGLQLDQLRVVRGHLGLVQLADLALDHIRFLDELGHAGQIAVLFRQQLRRRTQRGQHRRNLRFRRLVRPLHDLALLGRRIDHVDLEGGLADEVAGTQAEGEARTHDAGERGDDDAFFETELLDGLEFVFLGHFGFLGVAGDRGDDDAQHAHAQPGQHPVAIERGDQLGMKLTLEQRRNERAKHRAIPQRHRHPQRHAQIAHRQPEGQPAKAPQQAEQIGVEPDLTRGFLEHGEHVGGVEQGEKPRRDEPREESADEPVGFPGPAFDALVRHIETAGGEAAEPMKEDAKDRIHEKSGGVGCDWFWLAHGPATTSRTTPCADT